MSILPFYKLQWEFKDINWLALSFVITKPSIMHQKYVSLLLFYYFFLDVNFEIFLKCSLLAGFSLSVPKIDDSDVWPVLY